MLLSQKLPRLLTSAIAVVLAVSALALPAAAKGKKGKAVAAQSKSKSGKQAKSAGLSRREAGRRANRGRHRIARDLTENLPHESVGDHSVVPDRVEVLEYDSTSSADTSRWPNPAPPRKAAADPALEALAPARGKKVNIDSERVIQIQQALATRGFYSDETNGIYNEATVDAMRRFQINSKIAVTGYPTAHSLKRLGLGNW